MIKRLNLKSTTVRHPRWPDNPQDSSTLFAGRHPLRHIVVMVDDHVIAPDAIARPPDIDMPALLAELLKHPLVNAYRYSDDGPPLPLSRSVSARNRDAVPGWATVTQTGDDLWLVDYMTDDGNFVEAGAMGDAVAIAENEVRTSAYDHLGPVGGAAQRRRDAIAALAADQALQADIYVTERAYLHESTWWLTRRTTICTVAEAVSAVGLYLRAQGEFIVADRYRFNRGLYYWVGTRELLPTAWRWFSACAQHSTHTGDDSMLLLAGSLLQRVDRALEARDAVHTALNQPQDNDVRDDALSNLDTVTLLIMAAFDVAARVAHRVLGFPRSEHGAAWQKERWRNAVAVEAPALADLVAPGTPGHDLLTIVGALRNSVHGAALHGVHYVDRSRPAETLVQVPPADESKLLAAMDNLGSRNQWGVREILHGQSHVDPGIVVDRLFEHGVPLLNDLLDATPVETLGGVALQPSDHLPPEGDTPFAGWTRKSIRWQLGL